MLRFAGLRIPVPAWLLFLFGRPLVGYVAYADRRTADRQVVDRFLTFISGRQGWWIAREVSGLAKEIVDGHGTIEVASPLLIVHGAKDRIVPVRGARALHASLPGSQLHIEPTLGALPSARRSGGSRRAGDRRRRGVAGRPGGECRSSVSGMGRRLVVLLATFAVVVSCSSPSESPASPR